ncbi:MAG: hypothetical protein SGILL_000884, partial [Bacillariaceae sp.]
MEDSKAATDTTVNDPIDVQETKEENDDSLPEAVFPNDDANIASNDGDEADNNSSTAEEPLEEQGGYNTVDEDDHDGEDGTVEPDETLMNSKSYAAACVKMERVWRNKRGPVPKRWKEQERKEMLIPKEMIRDLKGQSIYPWIRLLLPEQDSHRQFRMKDKYLADGYCDALGFGKGTRNYEMLRHYQDPAKIAKEGIAGDLSLVVEYVLEQRISKKRSSVTIGEINDLLNELADLRGYQGRGRAHHNHQWRQSQSQAHSQNQQQRGPTTAELRAKWFRKVINLDLSPLEHKWLVRILLKKMEISVGYISIFKWLSPYAPELWSAHNNLKKVCAVLADPQYSNRRKEMEQDRLNQTGGFASPWEAQVESAVLGNTLSPMISTRSSFEKLMAQTNKRHETFMRKVYPTSAKQHRPLSLRFPALTAEIKLDGERFIVHIKDGKIEMNTRNGKWYSELYGPVLGPPLRRALAKYRLSGVILDGEIESWDNTKKTLVPFGENRAVASYRRAYLKHHGLIDPLDEEYHVHRDDPNVMRTTSQWNKVELNTEEQVSRGEKFWLKFMAFDILYVDGEDARRLFDDCGISSDIPTGSIINLPLLERKQILYRLLMTQDNEVEICPTVVIRCDGECVTGEDYFSTTDPMAEYNILATQLDSTQATLRGDVPNLEVIDEQRQLDCNDRQISRRRVRAVEKFYTQVVEEYKFEGLVVKDLASPYRFSDRSFWWKFKPDYESEEAEDVDVVILGSTFATGIRDGGTPSSYLVGVLDGEDTSRSTFMTLTTLNANSVANDKRGLMWAHTGFKRGGPGEPLELGKWFREEAYGLPEFISHSSLQRNSVRDFDGWTFSKAKTYPDLWINPKDSIVLTIKAQELVLSDEHSCGLSMRFPKIKKVRLKSVDGDEKKPSEIETHLDLWERFDNIKSKRDNSNHAMASSQSQSQFGAESNGEPRRWRFLTPEEYAGKAKKRKKKVAASPARKMAKVESKYDVLKGLTFIIPEGRYRLDSGSLEAQEASDEGWIEEGLRVQSEKDVQAFAMRYGGTVRNSDSSDPYSYLIGGSKNDVRVVNGIRGLENARSIKNPKTAKDRKAAELAEKYDGILKWNFIFSLVHRFLASGKTKHDQIRECGESLLLPGPQDYLARVKSEMSVEEEIFCLDRMISEADMQRALLVSPERTRRANGNQGPWQYGAREIPADERWILSSCNTALWPYREKATPDAYPIEEVVLYPDVFVDFGLKDPKYAVDDILSGANGKRWNSILPDMDVCMAVVPLARTMGALVTPHLHRGVNTVLCQLVPNVRDIMYVEGSTYPDIFENKVRGHLLLEYLGSMAHTKSGMIHL